MKLLANSVGTKENIETAKSSARMASSGSARRQVASQCAFKEQKICWVIVYKHQVPFKQWGLVCLRGKCEAVQITLDSKKG